ncbi:MAG: hypothetical protein IBJ13_13070, partial [Sphingopyxis sp.]|nr:hypothetical protein [Sphingopyxis sp.]
MDFALCFSSWGQSEMKDDTIRSQDSVGGLPPEMRRAMWRLILGYWGIMFVIDSLFGQLMNIDPIESAPYKLVGYSAVTAMSVTIAHLLYRSRDKSFLHKAMLALAAAAIATPILAVLDFLTYMACQYPQPVQFNP